MHVLIRASLPQGARTWILACLTDMHTRLFDSGSTDVQPYHIAALGHEAAAARACERGGGASAGCAGVGWVAGGQVHDSSKFGSEGGWRQEHSSCYAFKVGRGGRGGRGGSLFLGDPSTPRARVRGEERDLPLNDRLLEWAKAHQDTHHLFQSTRSIGKEATHCCMLGQSMHSLSTPVPPLEVGTRTNINL